jgi:hypothetical protein
LKDVIKPYGEHGWFLDQSNTKTYANATTPANINTALGDETLYLKGERFCNVIKLLVQMLIIMVLLMS